MSQLPSRRQMLQSAGALAVMAAFPARGAAAAANTDVTARLARYMAAARNQALPDVVTVTCKHRILDTFGAMVSGSRMTPGIMAVKYVRGLGGEPQASVIGADFRTTAINAALANAMCAHADETDDVEPVTKAHPGSSVIPAALAMAEKEGRSGEEFIRAVVLGYDLGCRLLIALGPDLLRGSHRSAEGTASTFAALGAAAARPARRAGHALCDFLFRPAGVQPVELGEGQGPHRKSLRFRRHGRAQWSDRGRHGAGGPDRRRRRARRYA